MMRSKNVLTGNENTASGINFEDSSEILKALSHPVRLKILKVLTDSKCCVNDISAALEIPQSVISQHLSILRSKAILVREKEGTRTWYSVDNALSKEIILFLSRQGDIV
jgi:DNA-binding transcriptional ArsR family regulator